MRLNKLLITAAATAAVIGAGGVASAATQNYFVDFVDINNFGASGTAKLK